MHHYSLLFFVLLITTSTYLSAQIENKIYDQIFDRKYTIVPYNMIKQYQIKGLEYYYKKFDHYETRIDASNKRNIIPIYKYQQYCEIFDSLGMLAACANTGCATVPLDSVPNYTSETVQFFHWLHQQKNNSCPSFFWSNDSITNSIVYYDTSKNAVICYNTKDLWLKPYFDENYQINEWITEYGIPITYFIDSNWNITKDSLSSNLSRRTGCGSNLLVHHYTHSLTGELLQSVDKAQNTTCYVYDASNRLYQIWYNESLHFTYIYKENRLKRVFIGKRGDEIFIEVLYEVLSK